MRVSTVIGLVIGLGVLGGCDAADGKERSRTEANRARCASYGFTEGTDGFANCMMQTDLRQPQQPDREERIRRYRQMSTDRMGDDRYPVCGAANMDAELDIETGKWVGRDCQLSPD